MDNYNPYYNFGDVVCINLRSRQDKRKVMEETFKKLNVPARFFTVDKHEKGGRYGCFDSHIQVIKEAYASGKINLLILEDDILATPTYSLERIQEITNFLSENETKIDLFFLGYFMLNSSKYNIDFLTAPMITPNIIKFDPLATHAYCITRSGMEKVLETYQKYIDTTHFDIYLSHQQMNSYCYIPALFEQLFCMGTDNSITDLDEFIFRKFQCNIEKEHIIHRVSYAKYAFERYKTFFILAFILCIIATVSTIVVRRKYLRRNSYLLFL